MEQKQPEFISSFKNPKIQFIRGLLLSHKAREENHACVLEGVRLAEEAIGSGIVPQIAVFSDRLSERGMQLVNSLFERTCQVIKVPQELFSRISATESDQGLLLVIALPKPNFPERADFVLILDGIKDPGNMGTILRTAAAAGTQLVIAAPGCVDIYSPKVLRSGMGAHFSLPVIEMSWPQIVQTHQKQPQIPGVFVAESSQGKPIWEIDFTKPAWVIIGGEAEGVGKEAQKAATDFVLIPMPGKSESLNAAIAAGIILFEIVRQRSK